MIGDWLSKRIMPDPPRLIISSLELAREDATSYVALTAGIGPSHAVLWNVPRYMMHRCRNGTPLPLGEVMSKVEITKIDKSVDASP